jgi:hypothetical protein
MILGMEMLAVVRRAEAVDLLFRIATPVLARPVARRARTRAAALQATLATM